MCNDEILVFLYILRMYGIFWFSLFLRDFVIDCFIFIVVNEGYVFVC